MKGMKNMTNEINNRHIHIMQCLEVEWRWNPGRIIIRDETHKSRADNSDYSEMTDGKSKSSEETDTTRSYLGWPSVSYLKPFSFSPPLLLSPLARGPSHDHQHRIEIWAFFSFMVPRNLRPSMYYLASSSIIQKILLPIHRHTHTNTVSFLSLLAGKYIQKK